MNLRIFDYLRLIGTFTSIDSGRQKSLLLKLSKVANCVMEAAADQIHDTHSLGLHSRNRKPLTGYLTRYSLTHQTTEPVFCSISDEFLISKDKSSRMPEWTAPFSLITLSDHSDHLATTVSQSTNKYPFVLMASDRKPQILLADSDQERNAWLTQILFVNCDVICFGCVCLLLKSQTQRLKHKQELTKNQTQSFAMTNEDDDKNDEIQDGVDCLMTQSTVDYSPVIRGATFERLAQIALTRKRPSLEVDSVLLLSYRNFYTVDQIFDLIEYQFVQLMKECRNKTRQIVSAVDDCGLQQLRYRNYLKKAFGIEQRFLGLLKLWLTRYYLSLEKQSPNLLEKIDQSLDRVGSSNSRKFTTIALLDNIRTIKKLVRCKREGDSLDTELYAPSFIWSLSPPDYECIGCDKIGKYDDLLLIHPIELARQITLFEFKWFRQLTPDELMRKNWQRRNKCTIAPAITNLTRIWNSTSFWVRKVILSAENEEKRIRFICLFVEMASACLDLSNFSSFFSLTSGGLGFSAVRNLEKLWQKVSDETKNRLSMFDAFYDDGHYRPYLSLLKSIHPPCIPFLPDYLTKVLKIEDGNPDYIEQASPKPRLINISKQRRLLNIFNDIETFQSTPFNLKPHKQIQEYFERLDPLEGMTVNQFEDYLYDLKNAIEKE